VSSRTPRDTLGTIPSLPLAPLAQPGRNRLEFHAGDPLSVASVHLQLLPTKAAVADDRADAARREMARDGSLDGSVAADDARLRPALLCPVDRRLPLARHVLESIRVEQRLVELACWRSLISQRGGYPTTFSTQRLKSALAIGCCLDRAG
jgi:hypothetical protein